MRDSRILPRQNSTPSNQIQSSRPPDSSAGACTVARAEKTESVVVLDGSRSMLLPYDIDPDRDRALQNRAAAPEEQRQALQQEWERAQLATTGRRIDVAREAILNTLHDTEFPTVVVFESCDVIHSSSGAAGADLIRSLSPRGGTPIAAALQRAADAISAGANRRYDGNITLVTDGAESCRGDPCAVARDIKRERPGIVINVIDIAGWTDIACVARETGGFVRRAGADVNLRPLIKDALTRQAVEQCADAIESARR